MSMLEVERLLVETSAWYAMEQKARKRFQARLAPDFGLLDYLRRDEMALSEYLALLLDPQGTHGQGDLYLRQFARLDAVHKHADWLESQLQTRLQLTTEFALPGGRRMDIYLHSTRFGLAIENKPWAADQDLQLHDYASYLNGLYRSGQWLLIYLCNEDISEQSLPASTDERLNSRVIQLTFYQLATWLEDCALQTQAPAVKVFVEAMARFVRERINGEMVMGSGEELAELVLGSEKHVRSAFLIAQQMQALKQQLLEDFIEHIHNELADLQVAYVWLDDTLAGGRSRYAGFHIQFSTEDSYLLRWAFDGTGYQSMHYGICIMDGASRSSASKARRAAINTSMCRLLGDEAHASGNWPWWTYDTRLGMQDSFPIHWGLDPDAWLMLRERGEQSFAGRVIQLARQVHAAVQQGELDLS
ncbi:PD-(D/E)XK nuclease family protein [Azotobacter chroococcum]|uniref:PD-(D/E)XK nuclease family protein n=1 Tax=Azotobacter chroococcum TaxID=353 RepID=A0AAQ0C1P7_9GAMM|nr:PD-(D/E)XK nuclease family protein [Azotobacter chroococcum]QQE91289.1 PD-(D/E)XK nuclease family protein [Azotobacter chroococcum]